MKDLMLDLETLGTGRDAAIIAIGALRFERSAPSLDGESFYRVIKLSGDIGAIDPATVLWWMQQSQEARDAIFSEAAQATAIPLTDALSEFSKWVGPKVERLWTNGPMFDERLIREANARKGSRFPIGFRESRCCRTYYDLAREMMGNEGAKRVLDEGEDRRIPVGVNKTKHNALGDCYRQAAHIQVIYSLVMEQA
jgi:exodeoxyribonuclease VIII